MESIKSKTLELAEIKMELKTIPAGFDYAEKLLSEKRDEIKQDIRDCRWCLKQDIKNVA